MIEDEELAIFESELIKLMNEYRKCVDHSLKVKIHEDMAWLKTVVISAGTHEHHLKINDLESV